jgi:predicted lipid-binding transport protein (Tim44 family)
MSTQFFDIILLAMIAGFVAFRLYSVLGRRTGNERSRDEVRVPDSPRAKQALPKDNVVTLPERSAPSAAASGSPAARGLMDVKLADRTFDEDVFLQGARGAHEMIVTAFAKGDRDTLRPLVNDDVFGAFDGAIRAREQREERIDFSFEGLKSAQITGAEMKGKTAEVNVAFESDVILAGYDQHGRLIEGEARTPHRVTDLWTFARDTRSRDPNWTLVATSSG